jgi:tRNA pseudouridine13 synthase
LSTVDFLPQTTRTVKQNLAARFPLAPRDHRGRMAPRRRTEGIDIVPSILPHLTAEIPAIAASFRRRLEDFQVDELPAYDPCGSGNHVYAWIEKAGITTRQAILDVATALGIPPSTVGAAGRKDARGITRQMVSVEGVEPARIEALDLPRIRVLDVARHRSKLRPGSLRGNRFTIRLRDVEPGRLGDVRGVLQMLAARGVPNYFGAQRFGMRGDTGEIGRSLLAGDFTAAVSRIVGAPEAGDPAPVWRARALAAAGQYDQAAKAWPSGFADCARLCRALERMRGDAQRAIFSLDRSVLGFYVSAYQAWLFNRVLAERIAGLDRLLPGDIVFAHPAGICSLLADPAADQARAVRFEISPTGPIVGFAMPTPQGEAGAIERAVLAEAGSVVNDLPRSGPLRCVGGRRPFRCPLEDLGIESGADEAGAYLELRFTLPAGSYATAVLREIYKGGLREGPSDPTDE